MFFIFVTRSTITSSSLKYAKAKFIKTTKTLYIHYNDKTKYNTENREYVLQKKYNLELRL